jgi:Zinc-binding dehydrogenase
LCDSGQIRPRIDRVFPLEEAAAALGVLSRREAQGKVILAVGNRQEAVGKGSTHDPLPIASCRHLA